MLEPGFIAALRQQGFKRPWRSAWACFKGLHLPHRAYLYSDREGFRFRPHVLQFWVGTWCLWRNQREIDRQKATR